MFEWDSCTKGSVNKTTSPRISVIISNPLASTVYEIKWKFVEKEALKRVNAFENDNRCLLEE